MVAPLETPDVEDPPLTAPVDWPVCEADGLDEDPPVTAPVDWPVGDEGELEDEPDALAGTPVFETLGAGP